MSDDIVASSNDLVLRANECRSDSGVRPVRCQPYGEGMLADTCAIDTSSHCVLSSRIARDGPATEHCPHKDRQGLHPAWLCVIHSLQPSVSSGLGHERGLKL